MLPPISFANSRTPHKKDKVSQGIHRAELRFASGQRDIQQPQGRFPQNVAEETPDDGYDPGRILAIQLLMGREVS